MPQDGSVLAKDEWDGRHGDSDEPDEGGGPARVQRFEHLGGEERETCTEDGSNDGVGGKCRGGDEKVRVDDVVEEGKEDPDRGETDASASSHRCPVVDAGVRRPAEPEEGNGEDRCRPHGLFETVLWGNGRGSELFGKAFVSGVPPDEVGDHTQGTADEDW